MTEKSKKGGAGKFFLGAALGALAGAIAGKFISSKVQDCDEDECDCGDDCECKKATEEVEKPETKKTEAKKTETKKPETKKPAKKD